MWLLSLTRIPASKMNNCRPHSAYSHPLSKCLRRKNYCIEMRLPLKSFLQDNWRTALHLWAHTVLQGTSCNQSLSLSLLRMCSVLLHSRYMHLLPLVQRKIGGRSRTDLTLNRGHLKIGQLDRGCSCLIQTTQNTSQHHMEYSQMLPR